MFVTQLKHNQSIQTMYSHSSKLVISVKVEIPVPSSVSPCVQVFCHYWSRQVKSTSYYHRSVYVCLQLTNHIISYMQELCVNTCFSSMSSSEITIWTRKQCHHAKDKWMFKDQVKVGTEWVSLPYTRLYSKEHLINCDNECCDHQFIIITR